MSKLNGEDGLTKLLKTPCPFCNSSRVEMIRVTLPGQDMLASHIIYRGACRQCDAIGPMDLDAHRAAHKWNVRGGVGVVNL